MSRGCESMSGEEARSVRMVMAVRHSLVSSPAKADEPVRRSLSNRARAPLEDWIARSSRAMTVLIVYASEAKVSRSQIRILDCLVASLLAMTNRSARPPASQRLQILDQVPALVVGEGAADDALRIVLVRPSRAFEGMTHRAVAPDRLAVAAHGREPGLAGRTSALAAGRHVEADLLGIEVVTALAERD